MENKELLKFNAHGVEPKAMFQEAVRRPEKRRPSS